ncbi:MAG: glycosyltransferase family 1 protein [Endomicrobiia bacterium]
MRIAVNTRLLLKNKLEGIGQFTCETLKRITHANPQHDFIFIFDRPYSHEFIFSSNITPVVVPPQSRHPILWYLFFEWSIPYILKKYKADLFFSPDAFVSLQTKVKTHTVIHDINFEHHPNFIKPFLQRKYYLHYSKLFAQRADRIAVVSQYTKQDIINTYGLSPHTIDVVYNGAHDDFKPIPEQEKNAIKEKYTHGCDFFIFIGSLHERKNLKNLLLAFDKLQTIHSNKAKLLIVGAPMWKNNEDIKNIVDNLQNKSDIIFTGRLSHNELTKVLASAFALMYVSFFEGFGIPILEAFRCGVPVITSNTSSMPEVAGNAALLCSPYDVTDISNAMAKILSDNECRKNLITKGFERANMFTWDKTATLLWNSLEKTMSKR